MKKQDQPKQTRQGVSAGGREGNRAGKQGRQSGIRTGSRKASRVNKGDAGPRQERDEDR